MLSEFRMNRLMKFRTSIVAAAFLAAATNANAHYLWIEQGSSGHRLHFGEAEMLLKETSPGRLDSFALPGALAGVSADAAFVSIPVTRARNHFVLGTSPGTRSVVVTDESMPVRDLRKNGLGLAKTNYYARFVRSGVVGSDGYHLPLDVTMAERTGGRALAILYRGQPLKGAKVQVIAPNTWMQEHAAQADGTVQINTPWQGQYVVHVLHVDKTPGEFNGEKYDSVRTHYTLTFIQNKGTNPGPAIPPKRTME